MKKSENLYRIFPTSSDLLRYQGRLSFITPVDKSPYDFEEVGQMYSANVDGKTIHLFGDEIVLAVELNKEEIIELLFSDLQAYQENIKEMLGAYLESSPEQKYWSAWFRGANDQQLQMVDAGFDFITTIPNNL